MIQFEARSDGDVVAVRLRIRVGPLVVLVRRLTALVVAAIALTTALLQLMRLLGW